MHGGFLDARGNPIKPGSDDPAYLHQMYDEPEPAPIKRPVGRPRVTTEKVRAEIRLTVEDHEYLVKAGKGSLSQGITFLVYQARIWELSQMGRR